MTKEQANFLKVITEYMGNQEIDVRDDYSGRGMMGKTTYGVVVDSVPILLCDVLSYFKENIDDRYEYNGIGLPDFDDFRIDNMGRGMILY